MGQNKKGFTIIELLLAMTMVSFLMMAIAGMILQMTTLMTRGNTFRELNAAGRTVNDDFTRSFNSLSKLDWDGLRGDSLGGGDFIRNDEWGAFCTGNFSYLWNMRGSEVIQSNGSPIKLVRIRDADKRYCRASATGGATSHLSNLPANEIKEIIGNGEVDLRIFDINFELLRSDNDSGQNLIKISYVLRTAHDGEINQPNCNPTNQLRDYCAINKFEVIVRTLGR